MDEAGAADGEAPLWALSTRRETAFDEAGDLMSGRRAVTSRGAAAGGPRARDALVARSRHCGWCARQLAASGEETGEIERVQGVHRQTMMCQRVCLLAPGGGGKCPFYPAESSRVSRVRTGYSVQNARLPFGDVSIPR